MDQDVISKTKQFLKHAFIENPSFSFNNWKIMYHHSLLVYEFSLEIADNIDCEKLVLSIGALLHDIGKTYNASKEVLRKQHDKLGYQVSKEFLENIDLTEDQRIKLKEILSDTGDHIEKQIIEDADIIAFFADEQLQTAFKKWADENELDGEMKRKLNKINKLTLGISKKIAKSFYIKTKKQWKL